MGCIGQTEASVRSGGAGDYRGNDATTHRHRQAFATRQSPLSGRPGGGRAFKALGRRLTPLAMDGIAARRHPSPRP